MNRSMALVILALAACTPPPDDADSAPAAQADPTEWPDAYTYEEDTDVGVVDVAAMQADLQTLADAVRTYNAIAPDEDYQLARQSGDSLCPQETFNDSDANGHVTYFADVCLTSDLVYYKGPLTTWVFADNTLEDFQVYDFKPDMTYDGTRWTGRVMKGQGDIFDSYGTGGTLDWNCSCTAMHATADDGAGNLGWISYTDGTTHLTGLDHTWSWMDDGILTNVWMKYTRNTSAGTWATMIRGTASNYGDAYGSAKFALDFSGSLSDLGTCDMANQASVEVRDSVTGVRYQLPFSMTPGGCTACAPIGDDQVCLDFSRVNDWETSPW